MAGRSDHRRSDRKGRVLREGIGLLTVFLPVLIALTSCGSGHGGAEVGLGQVVATPFEKLKSVGPKAYERLSSSLAVSQDLVVAATLGSAAPGAAGSAVQVFIRNGEEWQGPVEIASPVPDGAFGHEVVVDSSWIFVAAPLEASVAEGAGAVYVYRSSPAGITLEQVLVPSDELAGTGFGTGLAADEGRLAVSTASAGNVYLFELLDGEWEQTALLGSGFERLGNALDLEGDHLAVAAYNGRNDAGSVVLFGAVNEGWRLEQSLPAPAAVEEFADSIALGEDTLLVRANDAVLSYTWDGSTWLEQTSIPAPDGPTGRFGADLATAGNVLIVGAPGATSPSQDGVGRAHVYVHSGTAWVHEAVLLVPGLSADDAFGAKVAVVGTLVVVGATGDSEQAPLSGAAYLFDLIELGVFQ